ncbi:hypothetical protein FACS1894127_7980 [Clostridia bacterium]|nr:hypothetical protein FACS1894127_7980 [Clostridia bacterium]
MQNEYRVNITEPAKNDLMEIDDYISVELNAPVAAEHFLDSVKKTFELVAFSPKSYPKVRDDRLAACGYRWISIKNYIAFYVVNDEEKAVNIERVLYGRRDWTRIL